MSATPCQAVDLLFEDFEGVTLMPVVTFESELREREAWQTVGPQGPTGWTEVNLTTSVGDTENGVLEFEGWRFVDKAWWIATAGNQGRSDFLNGTGIIAVADPDEWDDFGNPDGSSETDLLPENGVFDSTLKTPSINIAGLGNQVKLAFSSSWVPEDLQTATIRAVFNTGAPLDLDVWTSQSTDPNFKDTATNERVVYDLTGVPAGATSVQFEFRMQGNNDWWWAVDDVQVFTGNDPGPDGVLRAIIDRGTGEVTIVNQTGATVDLRGYSIRSTAGAFDEAAADFLSESNSNWVQATQVGGVANDLSELHLSSHAFAANGSIEFGADVWQGYYVENGDIRFNYLVEGSDDQLVGIVEFVGGSGQPYEVLDLNFDGSVDILDWEEFRAGYATPLAGLTQATRYSLGDLDFDGRHSLADYTEFQRLFEQQFGAGAFSAMLSGNTVPEPSGILLAAGAAVLLLGRRVRVRAGWLVRLASLMLVFSAAGTSNAQLTLLFEDFEDVPLGPSVEEQVAGSNVWSEAPPVSVVPTTGGGTASWTIDDSGVPISGAPDPVTGSPAFDGVTEWAGWATADRDWWVDTAGDQGRSEFTRGSGNVFIADPDEWEDGPTSPGANPPFNYYDARAKTPVINIPAGIPAGRIKLSFDSSWRPEGFDDLAGSNNNQSAFVRAIYNGGAPQNVLRWDSDDEGDFYKPDATNERVSIDLNYNGTATTLQLEFALEQAWNDWWWAIDNVLVSVAAEPLALRINTANGRAYLAGNDVIPSSITGFDVFSASGQLVVNPSGGLSATATEAVDGPIDPDAIAGNGPGEQWEMLGSSTNQFAEAFLFGSSVFDNSRSESLGQLRSGLPADPAAAAAGSDLVFTYSLSSGDIVEGTIEYFYEEVMGLPGDFNLDGKVNLADYTVWRDNLGAANDGGLNGNGNNLGTVDGADYALWKQNFGTTSGSLAASSAGQQVPEPAGALLVTLALFGGVWQRFGQRLRGKWLMPLVATCAFGISATTIALPPAPYLDRNYRFGDADLSATAGSMISQQDSQGNYVTYDSAGALGQQQLIDLVAVSPTSRRATYVSTADRPDGNGQIGLQLNSATVDRQYLRTGFGEALNFPEQSPSSAASLITPGGSLNYFRINDRGFELWAKPTAITGQHAIVMDSQQHGVMINSQGKFSMRYASRYEVETTQLPGPDGQLGTPDDVLQAGDPVLTPADYATDVAAVANQWYHLSVVRPMGPSQGSIFYINGVAEAIAFGEYAVETIVNIGEGEVFTNIDSLDISPLTVGRATSPTSFDVPLAEAHFFRGVVDDLKMFVVGLNDNDNLPGGGNDVLNDWGEYIFERDNGYAQAFAPLVDGDLNGDMNITLADAGLFAQHWLDEKRMSAVNPFTDEEFSRLVGDLDTRAWGDFDYNGIVDLEDWAILNNANPMVGAAALRLIAGATVPEPSSGLIVSLAAAVLLTLPVVRSRRG
ncbi:hypothetical protein [Aeoliella sp. SH292]|uniref:hypothetical protein n=1 Tax=Aeoliella sp. SH292 TaxID=3454464 RepID=UPI003F998BC7